MNIGFIQLEKEHKLKLQVSDEWTYNDKGGRTERQEI